MFLKYEYYFCSVLVRFIIFFIEVWRKGSKEIQGLVDCFDFYSNYLKRKNEEMQIIYVEMYFVRIIVEDVIIEYRILLLLVKQ